MIIKNSLKTKEKVKYMEKIPYASVVGSILYATVCSRLDFSYAASMISRFLSNLGLEHWNAVKWVPGYLKGSTNVKILYRSGAIGELGVAIRYVDSDYVGSVDIRRSLTGYVFTLFGGTIS